MLARVFLAVLLLATWRADVYALHTVTVCGETCSSGTCNITAPLSCATNPAVTLSGGADFDFNGHTITCSSCSASADAIKVTASSSTIEDSQGGGGVRGAWGTGINCQLNTNSIVRDVLVDGPGTGIAGCRKVDGVVVSNTTSFGITNTSIGGTDYIRNSYVAGTAVGIKLEGSGAGNVEHNVIANVTTDGILTSATTSSSLEITGNTFFTEGGGELIDTGGTPPSTSRNVCGAVGESTCAACVSAGDCEGAETPFVGP